MVPQSQDPVSAIEAAIIALRHFRPRGPGRAGHEGPPWMRGGPHRGAEQDGPGVEHMPQVRGYRGPHDRTMGGAARFRLLAALRDKDGLSVSEIADLIGVDQPRASRLVNESAERGLVTRRADERDARRSVVELTEQGRSILTKTNESRRTAVADAVAGFTPEETATFAALLTRFVADWTQHDGGHRGP
jgi:DNA-binding MarR family transcriptional regulator